MARKNPLSRQHVQRIKARCAWICSLPPIVPAAEVIAKTGLVDRTMSAFIGDLSQVHP